MPTKYLLGENSVMFNHVQINRLQRVVSLFQNLGLLQAGIYIKEKISQKTRGRLFNATQPYKLLPKHAKYPLICRANTSDIRVFGQIFIEREYSYLDPLSNVDLIIDCGANVGYSSAYFLTHFPKCRVISVEPDPSNFALLEKNLAPYNERVKIVHSGVWSHPVGLKIQYRRDAWATQVRECKPDEVPDMQATDIGTLLRESGRDRISILKIDIEGAEAIVFARNYESWLPYVDNIVIELHDNTSFGRASDIFFNAISNRPFDISGYGELTVCKSRA
ncbi:MAG: FkbM family methyltransferase [Waterburya sp.]